MFKCLPKLLAKEDAKSHWLHLFGFSMLFHNRPVRADMGSVIVMVECDGVVVKVWLVPNLQLYFLASSGEVLAALPSRRSESESESCLFISLSLW